jgi:hypothetical protein
LPAGTLAWPQAWDPSRALLACGHAVGHWLLKTNPGLLAERMKSPLHSNYAPRDRTVTAILCFALCAWVVLIALDARRFGWSSMPA